MCEELARAFSVELPGWRIVLSFEPQPSQHSFHYPITPEELREDLDIARLSFPILSNDAR